MDPEPGVIYRCMESGEKMSDGIVVSISEVHVHGVESTRKPEPYHYVTKYCILKQW
jgi:hypothetical protein